DTSRPTPADTLEVGDVNFGGDIKIQSDYDVSGTGPGNFNLTFFNAGNYKGNPQTLTLGDKTLSINVGGTVDFGSIVSSAAALTISAAGGLNITGDLTLTSANGVLTLSTDGDILRASPTATVSAYTVVLLSTNGSIGAGVNDRVFVSATNLKANALTNVFISEANDVNLGPDSSSAGGTFDLTAASNIFNTATVAGSNVVLTSTGGTVTVNANITGTNSVQVAANGDLTTTGSARLICASGLVTLTSNTGNIGTSTSDRIQTTALNLVANAGANVFVSELDGVNLGPSSSSAGGTFALLAAGRISNTAITGTI